MNYLNVQNKSLGRFADILTIMLLEISHLTVNYVTIKSDFLNLI